jgi:hypothetical protein
MHSTSTACLAVGARCLVGGHEAGSPMQVFISPDDDRRADGCAPLTPDVRQPVAASTDSGDASNGEPSGGAIQHQRDFTTIDLRGRDAAVPASSWSGCPGRPGVLAAQAATFAGCTLNPDQRPRGPGARFATVHV